MSKEKEIRRYLAVIERASSYIKSLLDQDDAGLFEEMIRSESRPGRIEKPVEIIEKPVEIIEQPVGTPENDAVIARAKHIKDLLAIDCWPEAVTITLEPTEEDKINRASAVIDMMIDRDVKGKDVLDFGCEEGWVASEFFHRGVKTVVGYDINPSDKWHKFDTRIKFTTKWESIAQTFDIVLLYDVLDHCEDPEDVMRKIKSVLKPGGIVYVRCHPWLSKHGTHLYKQGVNRAFFHIFLTYDEIYNLTGKTPYFTRPEKNPVEAYNWWFRDLNITKELIHKEDVSDFFKIQAFKDLLASEQNIPFLEIDKFVKRMEIVFVDYNLTQK